jgi:hypothetical protein
MSISTHRPLLQAPDYIVAVRHHPDSPGSDIVCQSHSFPTSQCFKSLGLCLPWKHDGRCSHESSTSIPAAMEPRHVFFSTAASTFIFTTPSGGAIHLGTALGGAATTSLLPLSLAHDKSATKLLTNACTDKGLW